MSNITKDRLGEIVEWLEQHSMNTLMRDNAALLRELQLLRASAPVLSEEQREAILGGAEALVELHEMSTHAPQYTLKVTDEAALLRYAALLRAMAQRGK